MNDGLKSIGENAFRDSSLESVVIPDSVTILGKCAFAHTPLKSVIIGKGITFLDEYVFAETKLENVTVPVNVVRIEYAFFECKKLKSIVFEAPDRWFLHGVDAPYNYCPRRFMENPKKAAKCIRKGYNGKAWGDKWYRV